LLQILLSGIDQLSDGFALFERVLTRESESRLVHANRAFADALGRSLASLIGGSLGSIFPEAVAMPEFSASLEALSFSRVQLLLPESSSAARFCTVSLHPLDGHAGDIDHWLALVRSAEAPDGQDHPRVEDGRVASAARLAAGMTQEINTPLASLTSNLEWLVATLPRFASGRTAGVASPPSLESVSAALVDALAGAERVESMVRYLSILSGIEDSRRELSDVRVLLDSALRELESLLPSGLAIERDYAEVPPVFASEQRLRQAFMNLLSNAAHAVETQPDGRRIILRTRGTERVRVEIEDSGSGLSASIASRVFRPFVTTKPLGVGKGLGLFLCKTIVEAAGGSVGFDSPPGRGAMFFIELPSAAGTRSPETV
jgi:signal transduction histidine kinase